MPSFFLICINNLLNHIASTIKQLAADDILFLIAYNAKTLAGELNSDLKANLNGNPSKCRLIQIWIRLKKVCFHRKWQNHFTHESVSTFIICRNLSQRKIEFILPYLVRIFQINGRNKLISKVPSKILSLYKALSWMGLGLCEKNKLGSQIYMIVYKFKFAFWD